MKQASYRLHSNEISTIFCNFKQQHILVTNHTHHTAKKSYELLLLKLNDTVCTGYRAKTWPQLNQPITLTGTLKCNMHSNFEELDGMDRIFLYRPTIRNQQLTHIKTTQQVSYLCCLHYLASLATVGSSYTVCSLPWICVQIKMISYS